MASPLGNYKGIQVLESDTAIIGGFIALDGSSNVIGVQPTNAPAGAGPYTLCKGLTKAIGLAGAVVTQPHASTGVYNFTLDEPWMALLGWSIEEPDNSSNAVIYRVNANVRGTNVTTGPFANALMPGCDTTKTVQTVIVTVRNATGTLTDPVASGGFWINLWLKRSSRP